MTHTTIELCAGGYPASWPKANPLRPDAVPALISEAEKRDLYVRNITTRELALKLRVKESYLSSLFPGKEPARDKMKKLLRATRREYREQYARLVVKGQITMTDASRLSKVPYRSMARAVQALRAAGFAPLPDNIPAVGVQDGETTV